MDVFGGVGTANSQQMFIPQISASCPPDVKEESMRDMHTFGVNPSMSETGRREGEREERERERQGGRIEMKGT